MFAIVEDLNKSQPAPFLKRVGQTALQIRHITSAKFVVRVLLCASVCCLKEAFQSKYHCVM